MSFFDSLLSTKTSSTLIDSAFADIDRMLQRSHEMLDIALANLLDNEETTEDLRRMDEAINDQERSVRRAVLQHLAIQPEDDLVVSLMLVSIVQDCERLGDFARGLGDMVGLARSERTGPFRDQLSEVRGKIGPLFDATKAAFSSGDLDQAQSVVAAATHIKSDLGDVVREVAGSDLSADMAVVYACSARILSRVSSHLSNVCSSLTQPYDRIRHGDESA